MTKFEQIAVNYILRCKTMEEVDKVANSQCDICVNSSRCLYHDCAHCAVRHTKNLYGFYLYDKEYGEDAEKGEA